MSGIKLSFDCLYSIILFLDDYDIFRLMRISKYFAALKQNDKLWNRLWLKNYKHNEVDDTLNIYGNFLKCTLVKKFIQLNFKLLRHHYGDDVIHSQTPKRRLDRAMFIPMIGYNYSEHRHCNTKTLPESLRRAFKMVGLNMPELPLNSHGLDSATKFANTLLETRQLMMMPKKGDVLAFCETAWNCASSLMVYDGDNIIYCCGFDTISLISDIGLSWPEIEIDYWSNATLIPIGFDDIFKKNITFNKVPMVIDGYRTDVYSFVEMHDSILYLFFEDNSNIDEFDKLWDWNKFNPFDSFDKDLFTDFGRQNGISYLLFKSARF